jgi:hypothetical protein
MTQHKNQVCLLSARQEKSAGSGMGHERLRLLYSITKHASTPAYTIHFHNAMHNWILLENSVFEIKTGGVRVRSKITPPPPPSSAPTSQRTSLGARRGNTVVSRLSDLRLSDIPFYPTCRVGRLHPINSHSEGLNSIQTALAYVEQERETTATDVLLFRRWRDLAAKKRKEAQKQMPITNFLKK